MMLEVLVASSAVGLSAARARAYSARLASRFSKMASMTTSACAAPSPRHIRAHAGAASSAAARLCAGACRRGPGALQRRLDQLCAAVLQRHGQAAQRSPGRDIAAHDAGADDVHVTEFDRRLAAQALEAILQQEHPHQIARGGRAHERADGARLGLVARGAGGAVAAPQIDEWRRARGSARGAPSGAATPRLPGAR